MESVFSEMGGSISGRVKASGTLDSLSLSSEGTRFDDVLLRVGFTNVPYYVSGPFSVTDQTGYPESSHPPSGDLG